MKRSDVPLTKHTLLLREGDWDCLRERFPRIGAGPVIRRLVIAEVDKLNDPVDPEQIKELVEELAEDEWETKTI